MSDLEITGVDVHLLEGPRPWLIVRVETDAGVTGVGEVPRWAPGRRVETADVRRLGERLVGADPFDTECLFGAGGRLGAGPNDLFTTTIAGGLDVACWDLKGTHLGVPVHQLLGGKRRERVRAYANGWDFDARAVVDRYHEGEEPDAVLADTIEEITAAADRVVDAGYTALKFSPFQWGDGPTTSRLELDSALAVVEAVHETVPEEVELLIEGHQHLATGDAVRAARRLEAVDPGFYEEPVPAEVGPLREVARKSSVPIATGESFATHRGFAELIADTDVSVVQPDVVAAGGITELDKIAAMASAERVGFAPHNAAGPVMTAAAVQVDAATPAFAIQETFEDFFHPDWSRDLLADPLRIEDGYIEIPDRPGIGVELDKSVLRAHEITGEAGA
ncbi:MAG: mandelate racemase/muconate lactonizing enzyme family protein [Halobacteriales archaeon]